ncbi:unnamed protein product, partial [Symbiodinium sp. CCMP2456]
DQLLRLIPAEDFRCSGIQVVEDRSVRSILEQCGVPVVGATDAFRCLPHLSRDRLDAEWWTCFFRFLLDEREKVDLNDVVDQPVWLIRGERQKMPTHAVAVFCAVPAHLRPWREEVIFL